VGGMFFVVLIVGICLILKIKLETFIGFALAFLALAVMMANGK
jgi:hypothetical protein